MGDHGGGQGGTKAPVSVPEGWACLAPPTPSVFTPAVEGWRVLGPSPTDPPHVPAGVCSEFFVNTVNAGAGALSVTIDGPSKVQLDCQECPEGHRVTYTPMAPGSYLISIKYSGPHHIVGSPFKAKVTGMALTPCPALLVPLIPTPQPAGWDSQGAVPFPPGPRLSGGHSLHETSTVLVETVMKSAGAAVAVAAARGPGFPAMPKFSSDASKVVARGPGLSKAFVGQKNTFTVDCSKAGTEAGPGVRGGA